MRRKTRGFTMVELLFSLAVIGIVSAIAIPALLGSRQNARYTGDARTNASVIQMAMENFKADNGRYPAAGSYAWLHGVAPAPNPLPTVTSFQNGTELDFTLLINADRLTYTISVTDPRRANTLLLTMNQNGQIL